MIVFPPTVLSVPEWLFPGVLQDGAGRSRQRQPHHPDPAVPAQEHHSVGGRPVPGHHLLHVPRAPQLVDELQLLHIPDGGPVGVEDQHLQVPAPGGERDLLDIPSSFTKQGILL